MKKTIITFALLSSALCSAGAANKMPDPYSQPQPAAAARQGVHRLMGATLMDAGAIASGQKKWNGFTLLNRVDALEQISQMYNDFFFVPGSFADSNTRDDLLQRKTEFQELSADLKLAAFSLRMAARNHESDVAMKAFGTTIQACNACHRSFMKPGTEVILPLPPTPSGHK
ncbi:cytochrome c [Psychromonas aquimarina]|uniref:cytochrome c n=1 Tax=Psychromonas aquimarina TaxID=444919 RepID=UPI0004199212|nr:cytochrome c [Psychromonas aquimarina]